MAKYKLLIIIVAVILAELLLLLLFVPCVSLFAMVLRRILPSMQALGIATPLLIVVTLCACPVFFDLALPHTVGLLLPPCYFIRGAYDGIFIGYMAFHCIICAGICYLLDKALPSR